MDSFSAADLPDDEDMVSARCSGSVCGRRVEIGSLFGVCRGFFCKAWWIGGRGRIMRRRKISNSRQDDCASST